MSGYFKFRSTLGHALEGLSYDFNSRKKEKINLISHGEAVALGIFLFFYYQKK